MWKLGWKRGNNHAEIVFYQVGGSILSLFSRAALAADAQVPGIESGFGGITLAYCARARNEVDAVIAAATGAGATLLKPAQDAVWGGYSGYFADPDGYCWEVAYNPFFRFDEHGNLKLD